MHLTSSGSMFLILRIGRYPNQASDQANDSKEKSQTKVNTKIRQIKSISILLTFSLLSFIMVIVPGMNLIYSVI